MKFLPAVAGEIQVQNILTKYGKIWQLIKYSLLVVM